MLDIRTRPSESLTTNIRKLCTDDPTEQRKQTLSDEKASPKSNNKEPLERKRLIDRRRGSLLAPRTPLERKRLNGLPEAFGIEDFRRC